jgi:sec-independent protein translocase protein TatA
MEGLRFPELLIVLIIVAVLFGGAKLPQLGAGLGKAIRGFKDAMNGKDEAPPAGSQAPAQPPTPPELPAAGRSTRPG